MNSIRFVKQAIEYEARRQVEIIEGGGKIVQETRLFDPGRGETRSMRSKEDAHDYRYFPDPDLLPLVLTKDYVEKIKASLPELPDARKSALHRRLRPLALRRRRAGGGEGDGGVLRGGGQGPRRQAGGQLGDRRLLRHAEPPRRRRSPSRRSSAAASASCWTCIADGTISGRIAKDLFVAMEETGKDPAALVEERGLKQVTDTGAIEAAIKAVIDANPGKVAAYKAKPTLFGWFVGQVMKSTGGKANPKAVNELLKKALDA